MRTLWLCLSLFAGTLLAAPQTYLLSSVTRDEFLENVAAELEKSGLLYFATADSGGARVRPVAYTVLHDNKLIIATSSKKELYRQSLKNPEVEACASAKDGSSFVRFKGTAKAFDEASFRQDFCKRFPFFPKKYGDTLVFLAIDPEMVGIFSERGKPPQAKVFRTN